jgi:hypothetical protein
LRGALATKQSRFLIIAQKDGLLRCARNDVERKETNPHTTTLSRFAARVMPV